MANNKIPIEQIPILLTGCINPPSQEWLYLKDVNNRLQQYIESIKYYIINTKVKNIIFCENSNYPFPFVKQLENFASEHNKHLEWIQFCGNSDEVSLYGKGIGEDEIVAYAITNSSILKESLSFCKITGRLKVENLDDILSNIRVGANYFIKDLYRGHSRGVDTRFYVSSINFFKEKLMNCYSKNINFKFKPLEEVYYLLMSKDYKEPCKYPRIFGMSAGNGRNYSDESKVLMTINTLLCRLRIFNLFFPFYQLFFRGYNKIFQNWHLADKDGIIK